MFQGAVLKETAFDKMTQLQTTRVSLTALFLFRITPQHCHVSEVTILIVNAQEILIFE